MPARIDTQSAHNWTSTPATQPETTQNVSKKRQRMHLQGVDTSDERNDDSESDDGAFLKAEESRALKKLRAYKRLRKVEEDLRGIDERQSTLETGCEGYKKVAEAESTTIKDSMSQFHESVKHLPTSTCVEELVDAERKAREGALAKSTEDVITTMTASFNARINEFQKTSLKTMLDTELAPLKDRMYTAEKSLNILQVTMTDLGSQTEKRPSSADFQKLMAVEREEWQKALNLSKDTMSTTFTTQLDTRITKFQSDLETIATPKALESLNRRIDDQFEKLEKTMRDLKDSYTKDKERLEAVVDGLQQGLCAERKKNADMETSIDQFETAVDDLRDELRAEREKRENTDAEYEMILERLERIEQQAATARKAQEEFDVKLKEVDGNAATKTQVDEDIMPKLLIHGEGISKFTARFEEQAEAVKNSTAKIEKDLQDKIDQQKTDTFNRIDNLHSANNLDSLRNRVDKLEAATSQLSADQVLEITHVQLGLAVLRETVDNLVATTIRSDDHYSALQQSSNKNVDSMIPMSVDIAFLKDRHEDHEANYKAQIQEQFEMAKNHTNKVKRDLRGRIQDQEFALQGHLSDTHNLRDNPEFLALQARVLELETAGPHRLANKVHSIDRPRRKHAILTARVCCLATRMDEFEGGIKSSFNHLKSCVAEDLSDLEEKHAALKILVDNRIASGCKHVGCNQDS